MRIRRRILRPVKPCLNNCYLGYCHQSDVSKLPQVISDHCKRINTEQNIVTAGVYPSKHAYMGPIWATNMRPIWRVQPGSAWVPYGLAHLRVAQMGPI